MRILRSTDRSSHQYARDTTARSNLFSEVCGCICVHAVQRGGLRDDNRCRYALISFWAVENSRELQSVRSSLATRCNFTVPAVSTSAYVYTYVCRSHGKRQVEHPRGSSAASTQLLSPLAICHTSMCHCRSKCTRQPLFVVGR